MLNTALSQLIEGIDLNTKDSESVMNQILEGLVQDEDIVTLLEALDNKTVSSNEMLGLDSLGQFVAVSRDAQCHRYLWYQVQ